jgi:hypothetical protein
MQSKHADPSVAGGSPPQPGWIFDVDDRHLGGPTTAEILEVLHVPGYRAYRVRWSDGWESTFIPSCDHHAHPPTAARV